MNVRKLRTIGVAAVALVFCQGIALADTVRTLDGRSWKGLIISENDREVSLDIGYDLAVLKREKILRVDRSSPAETAAIRKDLQTKRGARQRIFNQRDGQAKEASLINQGGSVFVDALLGGRVKARLFLDTGSTVTFITENIAEELGLTDKSVGSVEAMTSDGRKQKLPLVYLDRLKIGSAEARHVAVAILPKQSGQMPYQDGLLGMSFLSRFNFKIDYTRNKLVLERHQEDYLSQYALLR